MGVFYGGVQGQKCDGLLYIYIYVFFFRELSTKINGSSRWFYLHLFARSIHMALHPMTSHNAPGQDLMGLIDGDEVEKINDAPFNLEA